MAGSSLEYGYILPEVSHHYRYTIRTIAAHYLGTPKEIVGSLDLLLAFSLLSTFFCRISCSYLTGQLIAEHS